MINKSLLIKLDNNQIDLTDRISFTYDRTNLPKDSFKFKTHEPIYWKIEQKHYDFETATLTVSVIKYDSTASDLMINEDIKYPIRTLKFEALDWKQLEPLLFAYTFSRLEKMLFNYQDRFFYWKDNKREDTNLLQRGAPNLFFEKRQPIREDKEFEIKIRYEDAKFEDSKICFTVQLKPFKIERRLEILNPNLRPEFEYIKPYFSKRLGKFFLARIKVSLLDSQVEQIAATSDQINDIDERFIDSIKEESVLNLRHLKREREEKVLYDTKDLSVEDKRLSILNATATDILEILIANSKIRNVRQLEYLAKDKQSLNERVRFTIKPMFGFVFNTGNNNECFVWELLNSHATYIWKSNNSQDKSDLSKIVEEAITAIKIDGREPYKRYYNAIESPSYDFKVIDHSSNNMADEERFIQWREKLESIVGKE